MTNEQKRDSSIELQRIITMIVIVAHHYIVNTGIFSLITHDNLITANSIFSLLLGWGGKTGINCFVLITGYFMCKSRITVKKFLKLFLEVEFYSVGIYLLFVLFGYSAFSMTSFLKSVIPFYSLGSAFVPSFLVFYLFIPFLNILTMQMTKRQHKSLIVLVLTVNCLMQTILFVPEAFTYVGWFMALYILSSYVRIYPNKLFDNKKLWIKITISAVVCSLMSVLCCILLSYKFNKSVYYWFVADSNKVMAVITAVSVFLCFKNLNIPYNKVINKVAASSFGVLLIHAHSSDMSNWLWEDLLRSTETFHAAPQIYFIRSLSVITLVYIICTIIDIIRITIIERPVMKLIDKIIMKLSVRKT